MPEVMPVGLWGNFYYHTSKLRSQSLLFQDAEANLPWHASLGERSTEPCSLGRVLSEIVCTTAVQNGQEMFPPVLPWSQSSRIWDSPEFFVSPLASSISICSEGHQQRSGFLSVSPFHWGTNQWLVFVLRMFS